MRKNETKPVSIVADGAIASRGLREGKLTPLVIIDTAQRPDIDELARIHQHLPSGDVECTWGKRFGTKNKLTLYLKFIRPSEIGIILEFDLTRQHGLVDQAVQSGGIYVQPGRAGDRLKDTADNPKILIQLPDTGFGPMWEKIFRKSLIKNFRGREGLDKRAAKHAAEMFIKEWREFGNFRMRS